MKSPTEASSAQFATRVSPQELGHIITLRKNLDLMGVLGRFTEEYLKLGWSLVALDARKGNDLGIDFNLPKKAWSQGLMDESLKGNEVNLAVRAGYSSRLFVVKVDATTSLHLLDPFGPWRSTCVAQGETTWEQHFYLLPSTWNLPNSSDSDIKILGEGALALAPPSMEPDSEYTWRWLRAPWESPPCPPPPGLVRFLEKASLLSGADLERKPRLSWREILARISGHKDLLSALLAPQASPPRYYQKVITEALKAGFREPKMLKALLWHAPHGDARQNPERWGGLIKVVAEMAQATPGWPASSVPGLKRSGSEKAPKKTLLHQLERITARTLELEQQLAALQQTPNLAEFEGQEAQGALSHNAVPFWEEWLALIQRPSLDDREVKKFQTAVANFLKANKDLAGDEGKLQLVLYCYANYIKLDPANAGLPHENKLAKAGDMARNFLSFPAFLKNTV
jgi:hypothetical protein